jgi:hypothetical protein
MQVLIFLNRSGKTTDSALRHTTSVLASHPLFISYGNLTYTMYSIRCFAARLTLSYSGTSSVSATAVLEE